VRMAIESSLRDAALQEALAAVKARMDCKWVTEDGVGVPCSE